MLTTPVLAALRLSATSRVFSREFQSLTVQEKNYISSYILFARTFVRRELHQPVNLWPLQSLKVFLEFFAFIFYSEGDVYNGIISKQADVFWCVVCRWWRRYILGLCPKVLQRWLPPFQMPLHILPHARFSHRERTWTICIFLWVYTIHL